MHEGGVAVERDALGAVTFVRPDGRVIEQAPPPPVGSVRALTQSASPGVRCWDGTRFNLGYVIDVLRVSARAS